MQGKGHKKKKCKQCKGHPCIHENPTNEIPKETEEKLAQKFSIAAQSMDILEQFLIEKEGVPEEILKIASKEELFQLGMDPVCIVAAMGHADGTRRFVEAGTNMNDKRSLDGSTPLMLATQNKHLEVVEILLKYGADVTAVNNEGNNAFLVAIKTGDAKLVNSMWPYRGNLDINHANNIGYTALHIAADKCWDGCVQFLLANGANIDQQCKIGRTALMLAVAKGDQKVVNRLIDSGADLLKEDKKGLTAICLTSKAEKGAVLNIFLEKLEEKNLKDAFIKNRLDRLKQLMADDDFEDLVTSVLEIIQKLTEMDNYRDVLLRQKLLPSAITIVQKHLKMKDAIIVVALIFATCMLRRDRVLPDERFVQQYIKSRGFEFSMKALKLLSDANKKDYDLMITCFFPIICACQTSDGKSWMEKNSSKIAPYICLRDHFSPKDFEFSKDVWVRFWDYYSELQQQTRDRKMAELLEEEERERNRKLKKKERKKVRRHRGNNDKHEQQPAVEAGESHKENRCSGDQKSETQNEASKHATEEPVCDQTPKKPKTDMDSDYPSIRYENITENAKTNKSRQADISKNILSEFAISSEPMESDSFENDNTWTTVPNRKSASKSDVRAAQNTSPHAVSNDIERSSPKAKTKSTVGEAKRKTGKCWADVAKVKTSPLTRSTEPEQQNKMPQVKQNTNIVNVKQQKKNYEDNFPCLNGQQQQPTTPPKQKSGDVFNQQNSPDYWCPEEWTFRSTSTSPSDFGADSFHTDVPHIDRNNAECVSAEQSSFWLGNGQTPNLDFFDNAHNKTPEPEQYMKTSPCRATDKHSTDCFIEKSPGNHNQFVAKGEKSRNSDIKSTTPYSPWYDLSKYTTDVNGEADLNASQLDLCKKQPISERFETLSPKCAVNRDEKQLNVPANGLNGIDTNADFNRERRSFSDSLFANTSRKYREMSSSMQDVDKGQRDWFLVENIDRYLREEELKRSAQLAQNSKRSFQSPGELSTNPGFDSPRQTFTKAESRHISEGGTCVAVVKPQGSQQKVTTNTMPGQSSSIDSREDKMCDLGESILRNVRDLQINEEDNVWFPSGLRGDQSSEGQSTDEAVGTFFPGFHDDESVAKQQSDLDNSFQQMRELAMYQLQTYYNGMRKSGPTVGSLYYHDIPYYASCLGVTEDDLERSFTTGAPPKIPSTRSTSDESESRTSGNQQNLVNEPRIQQANKDDLSAFRDIKQSYTGNQTERTADFYNEPKVLGPKTSSQIPQIHHQSHAATQAQTHAVTHAQTHATTHAQTRATTQAQSHAATGLVDFMSSMVSPAQQASTNTIRPWIQRSVRWRQKLTEIRNLPASNMKQLGDILIPTCNDRFLVPYSDTNAILGFLTDGSEVLVHMLDVTCRSVNTDVLRNIISPRTSQYFLIKYRTFSFENGRCFVAMDLPEYTLSEYLTVLKSDRCADPMVVNKLAWQFLKGLSSLHDTLGWQHGNMMPSNIFVDVEGKLLLSEYSFVKPDSTKGKFLGLKAIEHDRGCWTPTEVITETEPYSMKSDIQVAGMILHYILSGGSHPYGEINLEIQVSLQQNWPKTTYINDEVNGLINEMLVMPPSVRPSMDQVLKHPYFWANEKRLRFVLIAGSDVLRDMKSGTSTTGGTGGTMIDIINNAGKNSMFSEWTSHVDHLILKEMRSFRQYKNTLVELVLFVYNCCLHFDKLSQTARDIIDEPCKYFLTTFPALFMAVYTAIKTSARVERVCYKPFF